MHLFIDKSELRSTSRLRHHLPKIADAFGYQTVDELVAQTATNGLEHSTGADVLLSPLKAPAGSLSLSAYHVRAGAMLIQVKFGNDLTGSLGTRLKESLWRMRQLGAQAGQCVLLFVGQLGCNRDGNAVINKHAGRPRRKYTAVNKALLRWGMRGGLPIMLTRESHFAGWLRSAANELQRVQADPSETFWPDQAELWTQEDAMSELQRVDDWRVILAAIKGIGPQRATALRDAMVGAGAADTLLTALLWATATPIARQYRSVPKIPMWGDKTFQRVRLALLADDDIAAMGGNLDWRRLGDWDWTEEERRQ